VAGRLIVCRAVASELSVTGWSRTIRQFGTSNDPDVIWTKAASGLAHVENRRRFPFCSADFAALQRKNVDFPPWNASKIVKTPSQMRKIEAAHRFCCHCKFLS
jgi:hypothetical protein